MGYMNNDGLLYFWTKLKTIFVQTVNGNGPDSDGNVNVSVPTAYTSNPAMNGTASPGSSANYSRGDHVHPTDTSRAASSHAHGNITNAGALQTTDVTIASGDKLVVTDSSNSNKIARTSSSFDGSTTTSVLTKKGTFESANSTLTMDSTPTENSTNPVQSGGVVTYVSGAIQNAASDIQALIPSPADANPLMDGTAAKGTSTDYAREDHVHPTDTSRAPSSHSHGNITTSGEITSDTAIGNGDKLVVTDSSSTSKLIRTAITFDGTTTSKALTPKGTWENFPSPGSSDPLMDGTAAPGTSTVLAREDHVHPTDTSRAAASHSHGNISSAGTIDPNTISPANGDILPLIDKSDLYKLGRSNITFDGSTTSKALTPKGTWEDFPAPSSTSPKKDGTAAVGTETAFARGDHVHPTDTSRAPIASPTFTGTPSAPTAIAGTNTTQIATTAFVQAAISAAVSGVASFKGVVNAQTAIDGVSSLNNGMYWVVGTAGTFYGTDCEAGDFIYVIDDTAVQSGGKWPASAFAIVQTNITPMTNSEIDTILAS